MIKSKVTVIGNVTRSADIKNGRDGQPFITFGMRVRLEDGEASAEIDISVAYDGEDEDVLPSRRWATRPITTSPPRRSGKPVMAMPTLSAEHSSSVGRSAPRVLFNTRARRAHSATSMRTARRRSAMTSSPTSGCISWTSGTTSASG